MSLIFEKQNILSILVISIVVVVILIVIIKMYKKLIQRLLFYKKGFGKINGFFAKLFKVNAINEIYLEFYRSLGLWQKVRLYFVKKNILIDNSLKIENEFGIYFELGANQLRLYINPEKLNESNIKEVDILCLFNKVFKGCVNLVIVNVDDQLNKTNLTNLIDPINKCFTYISKYLSSSFNYVVNIVEQDDDIAYKTWCEYTLLANVTNFWPNEKPSPSWFDVATTRYTDKQLYLNERPFSSEQIRDLYCFLHNCLSHEYFINLLQAEISNKVAKYRGFGIDLFKRDKLLKSRLVEKAYSTHKFTKKLKKMICFITMFILTGCFIAGWYQIKNNIKSIANQIPLTCKYSGDLSEINLENYYSSLNDAFYNSFIVDLAYHNAGKKRLDRLWEKFIYTHVILRVLAKSNNPIQKLALNILQNQIADPNVRESISDNLWLWSKVTKIHENVLSVWLKIDHERTNTKGIYDLPFDGQQNNKTIEYIDNFIRQIFRQKKPQKISLDKTIINRALELVLLDQLLNDHDLNIYIHDSRLNNQISLSYEQRLTLNHFITYLELRDVIEPVINERSIEDKVNKLSKIINSIKELARTPWDKKLASFMLQNISDKFYLNSLKQHKYYYSYSFYEKSVKPINLELSNTVKTYAQIGVNINPIYNEFKSSLDKYVKAYKNYYYQKAIEAFEVNSSDIDTLISRLKKINKLSNLESSLSAIQKNILQLKNVSMSDDSFKGINNFYHNIESYNKLMNKHIDLLNKVKLNPELLIDLYQNNKHPFEKDMNGLLKSIKATPKVNKLFSQPTVVSEQVTTKLLQQYVQNYWNKNLEVIYNKVFNSFPFKESSDKQISVDTLTKMIGKGGKFWESYSKIATLIKNYNGNKWLTNKQFREYKKVQKLSGLLWDANGKPKPIKFTLITSELLPSYSYVENFWYFFKDKKMSYYEGILSIGKNSISDIGVGGAKQIFEVQWWLNKISSIALISDKKALIAQQSKDGSWSFWKLLKSADHKGNTFSWNFNNNNTKVSFDIEYSDIWFN
ncbi:hypothetical protein CDV26_08990 [Francisella halioticida]|uniref:Type VI secretion protein IcmF n=1 Tax=Francisella halioticida TaxID=549298 RepID=A0ABN5B1U0_9GAMM|nr:hypothetical protein [Francisella halioticida]ASG68508.1 hypothetical protein CDV26_08990 [Francisella halioticida]